MAKGSRGGKVGTGGPSQTKDNPLPEFEPIVEQRGAKITFSAKFKRNVGVLLNLAKKGEYNIEKWFASDINRLRTYYGYDDNRSQQRLAQSVDLIIQNAKVGNKQTAQRLIDYVTKSEYDLYTEKKRKSFDRSFIKYK